MTRSTTARLSAPSLAGTQPTPPTLRGLPTTKAAIRGGGFPHGHPLATWRSLNVVLESLDEPTAWDLLHKEIDGPARVQLLLRLYGRANKLRAQRERREVLGG